MKLPALTADPPALASNDSPAVAALARAARADGASPLAAEVPTELWERALLGPAREFLTRPGKQLRTAIVEMGWLLGGGAADRLPAGLPLIVEVLHAGSLIIDDIQDGSDVRRGAPALHHVIGTPLAINTGSWMYFWALAEIEQLGLPSAIELAIQRAVTRTLVRCHQGQALDLATKVTELAIDAVGPIVETTTRLKTGALCALAARLGALAAGGAEPVIAASARFGEEFGVALQMLDDLGSVMSPVRRAKGHEDLRAARPTWVWAWLACRDELAWSRCVAMARAASPGARDLDALAIVLATLIGDHGRRVVSGVLDAAITELSATCGEGATHVVAAELRRMEQSYG